MRFVDFFAGLGGFRLGMEAVGYKCVGYCEIVDTELNQMEDYFFGEPRMTAKDISYWETAGKPIIAWRRIKK